MQIRLRLTPIVKTMMWAYGLTMCLFLFPWTLEAQTSAGFPPPFRQAITDVVAYDSLIHIAVAMDNRAQELDSKKIKHGLWRSMSDKFGMDDYELAIFLEDCRKAHEKIKRLDDKAKNIITNFQDTLSSTPSPSALSAPPELVSLRKEKHAAVHEALSDFDAHLSKASRQKLTRYVQSLVGNAAIVSTKPNN